MHVQILSARELILCDTKRNLIIRLALDKVSSNKTVANAILHEVAMMEEETKQNLENLNSIVGTPQRSNHSPN